MRLVDPILTFSPWALPFLDRFQDRYYVVGDVSRAVVIASIVWFHNSTTAARTKIKLRSLRLRAPEE